MNKAKRKQDAGNAQPGAERVAKQRRANSNYIYVEGIGLVQKVNAGGEGAGGRGGRFKGSRGRKGHRGGGGGGRGRGGGGGRGRGGGGGRGRGGRRGRGRDGGPRFHFRG